MDDTGRPGEPDDLLRRRADRKDFFKIMLASLAETVENFARQAGAAEEVERRVAQAEALAGRGRWHRLLPSAAVPDAPRLRVVEGHAVYVLRPQPGGPPRALEGVCPVDRRFVQWLEGESLFRCPSCRAAFDPEGLRLGGEERQRLPELRCREEEGWIHVLLPELPGPPASPKTL
ncbi:MAG: hypothetical protein QJR08_05510 [Bacillota bacterium]|nr:hypothetical protein [Bacillota bacterium]